MKLHVPPGPLPIAPPYFDWEDDDDVDLDGPEDSEDIDLTDLFDPSADKQRMN